MQRKICLISLILITALLLFGLLTVKTVTAAAKQQLSLPTKHRIVVYVADG